MYKLLLTSFLLIFVVNVNGQFDPANYKFLIIEYQNNIVQSNNPDNILIPDILFGDGLPIVKRYVPNKTASTGSREVYSNLLIEDIKYAGEEKPLLILEVKWNIGNNLDLLALADYQFNITGEFYDASNLSAPIHTINFSNPLPRGKERKWYKNYINSWKSFGLELRTTLGKEKYFDANSSVYYYSNINQNANQFYNDYINSKSNLTTYDSDSFIELLDSTGITNRIEGVWQGYKRGSEEYCPTERIGIYINPENNRKYNALILDSPTNYVRAELETTATNNIYSAVWNVPSQNRGYDAYAKLNEQGASFTIFFEDKEYHETSCEYIKIYPEVQRDIIDDAMISSGSCVLINKSCGWFITNHHVVKDATNLTVEINNSEHQVEVIASDEANDLAIVQLIDKSVELPNAFRLQTDIEIGDKINTLGYPRISDLGENIKLTEGIISGMTFMKKSTMFQIDASITNGNSGGAVINENHELIGISTAGFRPDENTENVNGAIKSNVLSMLLESISYTCDLFKNDDQKLDDLSGAKKAVFIMRASY